MTREQAIHYLERIKQEYDCSYEEDALEMAIQALEQEPCEDAVSRKALISHIENQSREWGEDYDAQQILGDIEDMPSVKPQELKWIPVSERLPEKGKQVLCCNKSGSVFTSAITYINSNGMVAFGQHYEVIAWMPLPEPYKGEKA
jgi:hypothetical protein